MTVQAAARLGGNLIFLVSQPRAGSTLLQKMLGAHPQVHTVSEPWVALHPLFALKDHGVLAPYEHQLARRATQEFLAGLPDGEDVYIDGLRSLLDGVYAAALAGTSKSIFLDKTPRYYLILPELRRVFPEARFVFLFRNPVAVLASMLELWATSEDGHGLQSHWYDLVAAPQLLAAAVAAGHVRTSIVHYEALVTDPDATAARLCAELGLPADPGMVDYGAAPGGAVRWRYGDPHLVYQCRRPTVDRVERWRALFERRPAWRALAYGYVQSLSPEVWRALGYDADVMLADLGDTRDLDPAAFTRAVGAPGALHVRRRSLLRQWVEHAMDHGLVHATRQLAARTLWRS